MGKKRGYWTFERCSANAQQYISKMEWQRKSVGAYTAALKNGWLEKCCKHMVNPRIKWTFATCLISALKYNKVSDWQRHYGAAYLVAKKNGWLNECTKHMMKFNRPPWRKWETIQEAKKHRSITEWKNNSCGSYSAALRNGWEGECTTHMEKTRMPKGYWNNKQRCIEDARKYSNRQEWIKNSGAAYNSAYRNGWLEECCPHMELRKPRGYWNFANVHYDALQYNYLIEWKYYSYAAYQAAQKNGWLPLVTKHIKKSKRKRNSFIENEYYEILCEIGFNPKRKVRFKECRYKLPLEFDFDENKIIYGEHFLFEVDGPQHEIPIRFGKNSDEKKDFEEYKIKDSIKTKFGTTTPHFHLLRIHHSEFKQPNYREKLKQDAIKFVFGK